MRSVITCRTCSAFCRRRSSCSVRPAAGPRRTASRCGSSCRPIVSPASGRNHSEPALEFARAGRRGSGAADRGGNRRRPPAAAVAGLRRARCLHPRLLGAAPALVHAPGIRLNTAARKSARPAHTFGAASASRETQRSMPGIDESRANSCRSKIAVLTVSDTRETRRRQIRRDAGRAHPRRRPRRGRARDRQGRSRGDPRSA